MQTSSASDGLVLARATRGGDDLATCAAVLRAGSKSFHAASRLLPRRVREPAAAVYAFCRVADDAVDAADREPRPLYSLTGRLDAIYAGAPRGGAVDRALARVVARHRLPRAVFDALLEGFAWDLEGRRYETLDALVAYAVRVASSVGVAMTVLMGERRPEVLARATDLGIAMQLTNVARDVGDDARAGRIYLPLAWMREEGLDPDAWLARPVHDARLGRVVARLLAAAEPFYARADDGIAMLPRDCRVAIRTARLVYADIGREIARRGYDSVTGRAHTGPWRKAWLALRATGAIFWRRTHVTGEGPEPAALPLLAAAAREGGGR